MATTNLTTPLIDSDVKLHYSAEDGSSDKLSIELRPSNVGSYGNVQTTDPLPTTTNTVSTTTQIRLITWKNYKTMIARKRCGFCCKMCCPIFFILIMGLVGLFRSFMTVNINCSGGVCPTIDIGYTEPNEIMSTTLQVTNQGSWAPQLVCYSQEEIYTTYDTIPAYLGIVFDKDTQPQVQPVLDIISSHYGAGIPPTSSSSCLDFAADTSKVNFSQGSLLKYFASESALYSYIRDDKYAKAAYNFENTNPDALRPIAAAIVFKSISEDSKQWDYSLRLNASIVPDTFANNENNIVDRFERDGYILIQESISEYTNSWFPILQSIVDNAITEYIADITGNTFDATYIQNYTKGYFVFPFTFYETDVYWDYMQYPFIVFINIMFIYPILQIISVLVTEKSNKIKEGMKMMGLSSSVYWISMYLWFVIEFTVVCAFVTGIGFLMHVFEYSNSLLITVWFWLFCMSQMAFSTLVSTLFDNPKTATMVGFVVYFMCIALGVLMNSMNQTQKQFFCLLSTPCMMASIPILVQYENALIGIQWNNITEQTSQFSFATALIMMLMDCILYILLTIYLDNVWPSRFGQKKSALFCLFPSYWRGNRNNQQQRKYSRIQELNVEELNNYEAVDTSMDPVICIRDLSKTFHTFNISSDTKKVNAVKHVSLNMYSGEIFCLLGHNGAGKTTTINMLCGFLSCSGGNAWIYGDDINENMHDIRGLLGVCPQHDILWDVLNGEEHLRFFGQLKGIDVQHLSYEVNRIVNLFNMLDSGLWGKYPPNMSGGERRRLSLAIALIGGSKVVFLDEPTSGMDPENRRKVWDIIQKEKQNRCIILTTHYMDEADTLGDTIAIMADGVIKCCGSSLYLKRLYGVGYTFTVSLNEADNENMMKPKIDEILTNIHGTKTVSVAASEIIYRLPFKSSNQFADIFMALDTNKEELNISTFGISVTTLEEVFLRIGSDNKAASNESMMELGDSSKEEEEEEKYQSVHRISFEDDDLQFVIEDDINAFKLNKRNALWICLVHIYAILYKRFWWSIRDLKGILCQIILPVGLCVLLFGLSPSTNVDQIELLLNPDQWTPEYTDQIIVPLSKLQDTTSTVTNVYYTEEWSNFYSNHLVNIYGNNDSYFIGDASGGYNTTKFQTQIYLNNRDANNIPYYGFYFVPTENQVLLGLNASAYHSYPIALNVWNNWVLKNKFDIDSQINIYSNPLPLTREEQSVKHETTSISTSISLMIAFTLIPASSIYFIVNEKAIGTKHQQYVSGISVLSYWCGSYLSDILLGAPASLLVIAAVYIFNFESLMGDTLMPFFVSLMLFLSATIAAGYLLQFFFQSAGKAQFITILFNILLGIVFLMVYNTLNSIPQTQKTAKEFKSVVGVLPIFLLGDNILLITQPLDDAHASYFDSIKTNLLYLAAESIGYFALTLLIEYSNGIPAILARLGFVVDQPKKFMRLDDDVIAEQQRIKSLVEANHVSETNDVVILNGLRKVYRGESGTSAYNPAVREMYFGVGQSEVFGFLGTNGAGKTTTLEMLTGQKYPSLGNAFINGYDIKNQLNIRRIIGFCPQSDALFDLLTATEHINFYGLLKGLSGAELKKQRKILLTALSLNKYKSRTSVTYSGGNKRKLCVAQAMIGNPPVLFLDEPSTGMDPVSRRFMWKFINATMKGRCVILTTHSMEECEALCDRVGIMVAGQLSCIGSPQHLKSKFGKGYQLDVTLNTVENFVEDNRVYQILEELNETYPTSIIQQNGNKILLDIRQYQVIKSKSQNLSALGKMFEMMENMKSKYDIVSYALSQTSLEQVFLKMAKNKGVTDEDQTENIGDEQKRLLKEIEGETKEQLMERILVLNRDHLQQILQNEIRNSSPYIVRALNIKNKPKQQ